MREYSCCFLPPAHGRISLLSWLNVLTANGTFSLKPDFRRYFFRSAHLIYPMLFLSVLILSIYHFFRFVKRKFKKIFPRTGIFLILQPKQLPRNPVCVILKEMRKKCYFVTWAQNPDTLDGCPIKGGAGQNTRHQLKRPLYGRLFHSFSRFVCVRQREQNKGRNYAIWLLLEAVNG